MPCEPNTAYYKGNESQFFSTLFVPVQGTLFGLEDFITPLYVFMNIIEVSCTIFFPAEDSLKYSWIFVPGHYYIL